MAYRKLSNARELELYLFVVKLICKGHLHQFVLKVWLVAVHYMAASAFLER